MEQMKIIIIDHSISSINQLSQLLENNGLKIVATTQQKSDILTLIDTLVPDVVMLDITLIDNDYRDYIQKITVERKIPIIILSNDSIQETAKTVFAITNGASDYILKEKLIENDYRNEVIRKIYNVKTTGKKSMQEKIRSNDLSKQKHELKPTQQEAQIERKVEKREPVSNKETENHYYPGDKIIAIGTSTGGPRALQKVLRKLPKNFPVPIVIVQHMPSGFTKSLANRLNETCQIHVKEAEDGEPLQKGTAYIAPGNYHMTITEHRKINIFKGPEILGHRPSVNVLFESLANLPGTKKYIVILTGMGRDGSDGLEKLKEIDQNITVLIESEETAIIFGMPRAALDTGYVDYQLKIDDIGDKLVEFTMKRGT